MTSEHLALPSGEAIDEVVAAFRRMLESAVNNRQRIRIDAREGTRSQFVPVQAFEQKSLAELIKAPERDGSFELHVYIEAKR